MGPTGSINSSALVEEVRELHEFSTPVQMANMSSRKAMIRWCVDGGELYFLREKVFYLDQPLISACTYTEPTESIDSSILVEKVRELYGLSVPLQVTNMDSWGNTIRWRLDGEKSYFLKEKVFYLDQQEMMVRLDLHRYLQQKNTPISKLLITKSQATHFVVQGRCFELQEWIIGEPVSKSSQEQMIQLGEAIGKFGLNSKGFESPLKKWEFPKARNRWFPDHPNYFLEYIKCLDRVQKRGVLKESFFEEVEAKIKKTVEEIDWGALPLSWIHGDPSPDNSIFCRYTSQIFLIDLDDARMGFRVWDLVRALVVVGAFDIHSSSVKFVRKTWDIEPMQWILNGFLKHQKLESSEIDKFLSLLQLNAILIFISEFDLDDEEFGQCLQDSIPEQADKLLQLINNLEVRYLNVR